MDKNRTYYGLALLGAIVVLLAVIFLLTPQSGGGSQTGTLSILTSPGLVDWEITDCCIGEPWVTSGNTGNNGRDLVELPAGAYNISFSREGFDPATETVEILAGETTNVSVELSGGMVFG